MIIIVIIVIKMCLLNMNFKNKHPSHIYWLPIGVKYTNFRQINIFFYGD